MDYNIVVKSWLVREHTELAAPGITLRGFYSHQDITKKFLVDLISRLDLGDRRVVITSVFPRRTYIERALTSFSARTTGHLSIQERQRISYGHLPPEKGADIINVWYSGENSRIPSSEGWDVFLSNESDDSLDNVVFLPFWATRFGSSVEEAKNVQKEYMSSRSLVETHREGICAIIGNPEPVRLNFIKHLNKSIPVDVFGTITGQTVPDKIALLQKYSMNVCFENDIYPNYVTEKAFESWKGGCVPIWWGDDKDGYLNSKALVKLEDGKFLDSVHRVVSTYADKEKLRNMANLPILRKPFDYGNLESKLKKCIFR